MLQLDSFPTRRSSDLCPSCRPPAPGSPPPAPGARPGARWRSSGPPSALRDRKSTRLNSSHSSISYAVFCLKKFYNCDMYVDGHKAASEVRDEFVSVTENLIDELAPCYN